MAVVVLAAVEVAEGRAKLLRHEVVDHRVDGAVGVDASAAEEKKPGVQVGGTDEGVDEHQRAVGHPQQGKQNHHHRQHLRHLGQSEADKCRMRCAQKQVM